MCQMLAAASSLCAAVPQGAYTPGLERYMSEAMFCGIQLCMGRSTPVPRGRRPLLL